jgi:hypothetical protein
MSAALEALRASVAALHPQLPGLARVRTVFGLSAFECDAVILAAGCELDTRFTEAVARAHDDPGLRLPTLRLALAALDEPRWEALTRDAPLRRYELIEGAPSMSLVDAPYRVAERVLHELLGIPARDEALRAVLAPCEPGALLTPANEATLAALADAWGGRDRSWPAIVLSGADVAAKRAIAARLADGCGLDLRRVDAAALGADVRERERTARLCEREAALTGFALLVELDDDLEPPERRCALHWLDELRAATIVCVRERVRLTRRAVRHAEVERPSPADQRSLWHGALGERGAALNGQLDRVVSHFALDTDAVARIGAALGDTTPISGEALWQSARHDARSSLDALAERLPQRCGWDSLVLPEQQMDALREMVAHVRQRSRVYEQWGFARDGRGLGASALFVGPSGTGKSLAAEVIANELGLDAYRVDLSAVVSKYIGETEKNLRRVFDAAESGGAVLLFDEADALFGKRTEVRDSHDRYANIEVSYLLQRMESYRGLAILTSNFKNAIDDAFLRRLRFVIEFPFPDAVQRAAIWSTMFPAEMPRRELAFDRLAQLNVTGGNIRNIALHAAFVAADHGDSVTMADVLRAARTEYAKLGRPIGEAELSGWR